MKLIKILLASTVALTATTMSFAASSENVEDSEKVVVSTQEQPVADESETAAQPVAGQPTSESAAEGAASTPTASGQ